MTLFRYIPELVKQPIRNLAGLSHPYGLSLSERRRLMSLPRFQSATIQLFKREFQICDAASFLYSHDEIFARQIYRFEPDRENPNIIDAGANIGLSALYFAREFPDAQITCIEPDSRIVKLLRSNVSSCELDNVKVLSGAAWKSSEKLNFSADHADGGHLSVEGDEIVTGIRVRDLLAKQETDLLKMDIEGAETTVLTDCSDMLFRVKRLFVEYHSFVDQPQTLSEILEVLNANGFRYYIDRTGVQSSHPLVKMHYESGFDLQLNIFATRREAIA